MRWLVAGICGYVALALETAVFRPGLLAIPVAGHWARPDLPLLVALFLALSLEPHQTFAVAWLLGLGADLAGVAGRLGLQATFWSAALAAMGYLRGSIDRTRTRNQMILSFAAVAVLHWAWYSAARLLAGAPFAPLRSAEQALLDALYTAVLAPYVFWGLLRLRPLMVPRTEAHAP